jgi:hypothetical protein
LALLIRHKHGWFWFCVVLGTSLLALGARGLVAWLRPGTLTGGTSFGLWTGLGAAACMIASGVLPLHRRLWPRHSVWPRDAWLRAHVWFGLLSVVLVFCHAGLRVGGPLEIILLIVFAAVVLSGVAGWIIQATVPSAMTDRFGPGVLPDHVGGTKDRPGAVEAPDEQIPHVCDLLRRSAIETLETARANPNLPESGKEDLKSLLDEVHDFLRPTFDPRSRLASSARADALFSRLRGERVLQPVEGEINQAERLCHERRLLEAQARMHRRLHFWLLLHLPLSVALLVFGAAHAFTAVFW